MPKPSPFFQLLERSPDDALHWVLRSLVEAVPGAVGAALADGRGFTIATYQREVKGAAAAVATQIMLGARDFFAGLDLRGDPYWVTIEGEGNSVMVCAAAARDEVLILIMDSSPDLARAKGEMQRASILAREVIERL